jgi:hypothetical protein
MPAGRRDPIAVRMYADCSGQRVQKAGRAAIPRHLRSAKYGAE